MRALTVESDRPGAVTVIYGDGSSGELEIERSESLMEHSILMARLAPSSQYSFQVLSDADQYTGDFTTAGLPNDLAGIDFNVTGTPTHPLTLVELHSFPFDDPDSFGVVVIIDGAGSVVWYFREAVFGVTRRPSGSFVFMDLALGLLEVTPAGSVVEVELTGALAQNVWEFRPPTDNWSRAISSARRLPDGNTLIGFGIAEEIGGSSGPIEVYEVTPTGDLVWHVVIDGHVQLMYRATALADIAGDQSW